MPPLLEDPRFRQTWNQFSQNAESATETAAAGIWTFQHRYINPCFSSLSTSVSQCTGRCIGDRDERVRRQRERTRGRAELSFDFYDDWDEDQHGGLLGGWGNDELDRLLAGRGTGGGEQPRRKRGMSYGTRGGRRKSLDKDPTIIPSSSALGFLGRLPFKLGGTLRYKPSAADLQEHPGGLRRTMDEDAPEGEPLMDEHSDEEYSQKRHRRQRSSTTSSGETSDSFRSRGDLFPSDGEDDAVPLSDEFAMALERRGTMTTDDRSSGKTRSSKGKRPAGSKPISRNQSATSQTKALGWKTGSGTRSLTPDEATDMPSLADLQAEEDRMQREEDAELERKRSAAARLAQERGLHSSASEKRAEPEQVEDTAVFVRPTSSVPISPEKSEVQADPNSPHITTLDPSTPVVGDPNVESPPESTEFVPARLPHFS